MKAVGTTPLERYIEQDRPRDTARRAAQHPLSTRRRRRRASTKLRPHPRDPTSLDRRATSGRAEGFFVPRPYDGARRPGQRGAPHRTNDVDAAKARRSLSYEEGLDTRPHRMCKPRSTNSFPTHHDDVPLLGGPFRAVPTHFRQCLWSVSWRSRQASAGSSVNAGPPQRGATVRKCRWSKVSRRSVSKRAAITTRDASAMPICRSA